MSYYTTRIYYNCTRDTFNVYPIHKSEHLYIFTAIHDKARSQSIIISSVFSPQNLAFLSRDPLAPLLVQSVVTLVCCD
jgi:hypothetical protein